MRLGIALPTASPDGSALTGAALIAAAIAGVLLLRDGPAAMLGVEEALTMELEDRTLPDLMEQSPGADPFLMVELTF